MRPAADQAADSKIARNWAGSGGNGLPFIEELASDACATPSCCAGSSPCARNPGSPLSRAQPASACGASAASLPSSAAISAQT